VKKPVPAAARRILRVLRVLPVLLVGLLLPAQAEAQLSFSGEAVLGAVVLPAWPYDSHRFDSIVNPGNIAGLKDVSLDYSLDARLAGGNEKADFRFRMIFAPAELPQVLRANAGWRIRDSVRLRLGRQSLLTGYGYGWNPMDFANPLKDPADPAQELEGVDALSLLASCGSSFTLKLTGIYRPQDFSAGGDYEDLQAALELTLALPAFELKLTGFYDYDGQEGEDAYVPAAGLGLMLDLAGIGVYAEAAVQKGSRVYSPQLAVPGRDTDRLFSGLAGLQYVFISETSVTAELFFNGEGLDRTERELYADHLSALDAYFPDWLSVYRPGYFARTYLLVDLRQPVYAWNLEAALACILSPDSGALSVLPSLSFDVTGALTVNLSYSGLFSLKEDEVDEARLAPAPHSLRCEARYSY
jgi:hypothetical protein